MQRMITMWWLPLELLCTQCRSYKHLCDHRSIYTRQYIHDILLLLVTEYRDVK